MDTQLEGVMLATGQLKLRPLVTEDAPRISALMNNWNVARMLAMPPFPYALADAQRYLANVAARAGDERIHEWAITCDGTFIGGIGYGTEDDLAPQIGYWLGEAYWSNGYMTEALRAVVGHFFASQPDSALHSGVFADNPASLHLQRKLGFEVVGGAARYCVARGEDVEHFDTRLTRQAYGASNR